MPERNNVQSPIVYEVVARVLLVALVNARVRGAQWQTLAEEFLGTTEVTLQSIDRIRFTLVRQQAEPARVMSEMNETVLALLERLADAVWSERGQSTQDPYISILSPGTPNFFFDWPIGRHVDRLEILLELFADEKTSTVQSEEVVTILAELRAMIPQFRVVNESVRAYRAKLEVLEKAAEVVTRVGHVQYSRLRRRMRAEGFDAFEVRQVFPDIPGASTTGTLG